MCAPLMVPPEDATVPPWAEANAAEANAAGANAADANAADAHAADANAPEQLPGCGIRYFLHKIVYLIGKQRAVQGYEFFLLFY